MIKAIIFDLDNTLLDFVKMKQFAVKAAITAMIEAGLDVDRKKSLSRLFLIYTLIRVGRISRFSMII